MKSYNKFRSKHNTHSLTRIQMYTYTYILINEYILLNILANHIYLHCESKAVIMCTNYLLYISFLTEL